MGKKRRKGPKDQRKHGTVEQLTRKGKTLLGPFTHELLKQSSWVDQRLPDQLFSALLITHLDRQYALDLLRHVAYSFRGAFNNGLVGKGQDFDLTLTGLAAIPAELAEKVIATICQPEGAVEALQPLKLFHDLPGHQRWDRHLGVGIYVDSWQYLATTVAEVLDHQSQPATDTRWARVLFRVSSGQYHVPQQMFEWFTRYPSEGDQRAVRPSVRASEIAEDPRHDYSERKRWAKSFWHQCLRNTPCERYLKHRTRVPNSSPSRAVAFEVLREVARVASESAETSGRDARHSSAFGLVAYALNILLELFGIGVAQGILGRLGLRAIFEAYITLLHMIEKDDPALWEGYREYGQGQAKLALLKVDSFVDPPAFVTAELLEELATEDKAPYMLDINLGHWANLDLRRLSDGIGRKDEYDRTYPWTSAFVHGNWAAVRAACFSICGNPLHRLHAVVQPCGNAFDDVIGEASELIQEMLDSVAKLYSVSLPKLIRPDDTERS
jgi:hypothetical protein